MGITTWAMEKLRGYKGEIWPTPRAVALVALGPNPPLLLLVKKKLFWYFYNVLCFEPSKNTLKKNYNPVATHEHEPIRGFISERKK